VEIGFSARGFALSARPTLCIVSHFSKDEKLEQAVFITLNMQDETS
jgi:hypothetical protein